MPDHCSIAECGGNYDKDRKATVFRLPKDPVDRQRWINVLPPLRGKVINPKTFRICRRHWPADTPTKPAQGGTRRPIDPPSIFENVPASVLPSPKPPPRPAKDPNRNLEFFLENDKIKYFETFNPDSKLREECKNILNMSSFPELISSVFSFSCQKTILNVKEQSL